MKGNMKHKVPWFQRNKYGTAHNFSANSGKRKKQRSEKEVREKRLRCECVYEIPATTSEILTFLGLSGICEYWEVKVTGMLGLLSCDWSPFGLNFFARLRFEDDSDCVTGSPLSRCSSASMCAIGAQLCLRCLSGSLCCISAYECTRPYGYDLYFVRLFGFGILCIFWKWRCPTSLRKLNWELE